MKNDEGSAGRDIALSIFVLLLALVGLAAWLLMIAGAATGIRVPAWLSIAGFAGAFILGVGAVVLKGSSRYVRPGTGETGPVRTAPEAATATKSERPFPVFADDLTGLPARLWFTQTLTTELARSRRYKHPLSLIVLDVDKFSSVNSAHGQATGDYLLMTVAKILKSTVRQSDLVGRIGDDSFAVLAPETELAGALQVGEKLRRAIELYPFDEELQATVSVIVSQLGDTDRPESTLPRIERAVLAAKERGGNVVFKLPPPKT